MPRTTIPTAVEHAVLSKSRRRCALCFHLEFEWKIVAGQIAHVDRDSRNSAESNLVFLCQPHHDQYDTVPRQTKRLQPSELQAAKAALEDFMARNHDQLVTGRTSPKRANRKALRGVPLDVFAVRVPVYRALVRLLVGVFRDARVEDDAILEYGRSIQEAAFLFDDEVDAYLHEVYRRAVRLSVQQRKMVRPEVYDAVSWNKIVDDESEQVMWLTDQADHARRLFVPFLRLSADRTSQAP